MVERLDDLSVEAIDRIEQSREVRAGRRAEQREWLTESSVALGFVLAATAMLLLLAPQRGWGTALWLTLICALLIEIEFEVGAGHTRPLQLAFVPMLLLLAPALVPIAVVSAHLPRVLVKIARRRAPARRLVVAVADSSFALAPALVLAASGRPGGLWGAAAVCLAALAAMMASDLAISWVRMRIGMGIDPRPELRGFAWVCLVDLGLAPVGFLAGLVGREHPVALVAVLPLAGLLAVFARERRGRIENAMALHRAAQEGSERLQSIVQHSSDCILIVDADATIKTVTGSIAPIFGSAAVESAEGERLLDRVHPQDAALVGAFLESVAAKPAGEPQEAEWRMRYADGTYRHIAAVATNLLADPRVGGIVITARDVEARKAFEEQLRHRAFHDALTGLANRALFYDRIEQALSRRTRADAQIAVLYIDLDDFKAANDARGHAEGDRLLQHVAARLTACLRSTDTAARLGGDEFGVLLEGVTDPATVAGSAARLLEALAASIDLTDSPVRVSASVGMAISTADDHGVEEFLRKADLAMYEAKRKGKRQAVLYEPALERGGGPAAAPGRWFTRDDEQRAEIQALLDDPDAISIVFQPIMDLRTGRAVGYEALSRFAGESPRGPDVWFAQAHRCGLGYALEAKAITAALATPGRPAGTYLAVNLSPSSLLSDEVLRVLPQDLGGLVVEITENELVSGDTAIRQALAELRSRHARLAVDDTGSGYAGLTHVMRVQPDIIKLDRTLVTGVDSDPAKAALINSFVRYARDIDAEVCAEGVETLQELACLADLDVAFGQGYGIARPSPPWTAVSTAATAACLRSFTAVLTDHDDPARVDPDHRLQALARRLAATTTAAQLRDCLAALAGELHADDVRILGAHTSIAGVTQLLADDPTADPAAASELRADGYGSRLTLPITAGDQTVGHLQASTRDPRPWTRFQINRARLVSYQLAPLLRTLAIPAVQRPSPVALFAVGADQPA